MLRNNAIMISGDHEQGHCSRWCSEAGSTGFLLTMLEGFGGFPVFRDMFCGVSGARKWGQLDLCLPVWASWVFWWSEIGLWDFWWSEIWSVGCLVGRSRVIGISSGQGGISRRVSGGQN